jgi:DNA-binding NarL/FixJ family response regulator
MVASSGPEHAPATISVLIADGRRFFSAGLRRLFSEQGTVEVVADAVDPPAVAGALASTQPDVILLSYGLSDDLSGTLHEVRAAAPGAAVLLYGVPHTSDITITALRLGVKGLIDEDATLGDVIAAVESVACGRVTISPRLAASLVLAGPAPEPEEDTLNGGRPRLTLRELDVLRLVAGGLSNRDVATSLGVSEHTIRAHLREVMRKLRARSRIQAVTVALRLGLLPPAG